MVTVAEAKFMTLRKDVNGFIGHIRTYIQVKWFVSV